MNKAILHCRLLSWHLWHLSYFEICVISWHLWHLPTGNLWHLWHGTTL